MWVRLLSLFLSRLIRQGALTVVYPDTKVLRYGDPTSLPVTVRLHDRTVVRKLFIDPDMTLGEAYTDGLLTIDNDDLYALIELLLINLESVPEVGHYHWLSKLRRVYRRVAQFNPVERSRRNVAHHYDLSDTFYSFFLDADRQYSCAYFREADDNLENAQRNKKELIAAKLLLAPGQRVLDIGCGWGGLGLHLARDHGAKITGVTLSHEQQSFAEKRAIQEGLSDCAQFCLQDYRHVDGAFDRIVSVGMFEHVGVPHYRELFATVHDRLSDNGVALIHTIGRADGPAATNPWIAKYIFPGGYSPALSEILSAVEKSGLYVTDIEVWRLHYATTLKVWRERFEANLDKIRLIYDEPFCRMWRFYLICSELAFRVSDHVVFQIQLAKTKDSVPLTRDYLLDNKAGDEPGTSNAA